MNPTEECITCRFVTTGKCPKCLGIAEVAAEQNSEPKLSFSVMVMGVIKHPIIKYTLIGLVIIILLGIAAQLLIPGCHCQLESCRGCGDIGNALGRFSIACMALATMGFVLLVWFGVPLAILWVILYGIYNLFNKNKDGE